MGYRSDEELLEQARGCVDATVQKELLGQLFGRYESQVTLWCFRVTGDRSSAADLVQDIFVRAYASLHSFRGDAKFSTWLYTITRNHCLNDVRRRLARWESTTEPLSEDTPDEDRFDLRLEWSDELRQMRKMLNETLDETERLVMTLHYFEEMPLEAVSRLLGLRNASGAKAYIVSARRKLKTAVARWRGLQMARKK
jgi:RNA polymerase sigma-70 factor, ECF subfamily